MPKFLIQHSSITLASLSNRTEQQNTPLPMWKFDFANSNIILALGDLVEDAQGVKLHTGLNITVALEADSQEQAEIISKGVTENLLNLITFSTLTFCHPAQLVSIISIDKQPLPRLKSYLYPFDKNELIGSLTLINEQTFREIYQAFASCTEMPRVARALSWLRKGVNEENLVDEFTAYWVGIEVIKSVLRRMLQMRKKNPGEWDGVKDIYENHLQLLNFKKVEEARNGLLHGYRELDNVFVNEIKGYVEPTRKTLIASIANILKLNKDTLDSLTDKKPRRLRKRPWTVIEGDIEKLPQDPEVLLKNLPRIRPENLTVDYSINESGEVNLNINMNQRLLGPPEFSFKPTSHEQWGDEDAGITKVEVKD